MNCNRICHTEHVLAVKVFAVANHLIVRRYKIK